MVLVLLWKPAGGGCRSGCPTCSSRQVGVGFSQSCCSALLRTFRGRAGGQKAPDTWLEVGLFLTDWTVLQPSSSYTAGVFHHSLGRVSYYNHVWTFFHRLCPDSILALCSQLWSWCSVFILQSAEPTPG